MNPLQRYEADLKRQNFAKDAAQSMAVRHTQQVYENLLRTADPESTLGWVTRRLRGNNSKPLVKGLYFWGGVGRGKTYIMDCFYECLPFAQKSRLHFHRFMQTVHQALQRQRDRQNPLQLVADDLAKHTRVLCFDEFHVADITDAMLLGTLLEALFTRGITLIATSNEPPERLYWGGLQRERFLPAIALLKQHTDVINVDGGTDYRLRALERAEIYHFPLDAEAERSLMRSFEAIVSEPGHTQGTIDINDRLIPAVRLADGLAWFEFNELCGGPRCAADYIEIARYFHTLILANITQLDDSQNDAARRFIILIDELYDHSVKLIVSAAVPPAKLYIGTRLTREFQRTRSRLEEMQSHAYLEREHLP